MKTSKQSTSSSFADLTKPEPDYTDELSFPLSLGGIEL
jgi:hypothetical protein